MIWEERKLFFLDGNKEKVVRGKVSHDGIFITVLNDDDDGSRIQIHQDRIVFIRDIKGD